MIRQPYPWTRRPVNGRKIELARPPTSVMLRMAFVRDAGAAAATTTANAGGYSTIADAIPIATKTPYNCTLFCTCDQPSTAMDASTEPDVISPRPPRTSSHRPTGIDIRPLISTAVVDAPTAVVVEIPSS